MIASLLAPVLIGFALVRLCIPGGKQLCSHDWLRFLLGIGAGLGLCSLTFFLWLLTYGSADRLYIGAELVMGFVLAVLAAGRATGCPFCQRPAVSDVPTGFVVLFGLIFAAACLSFVLESRIHPHGQNDAWAIWNLKARFLFRGGDQWRAAFSRSPTWSHPDYPLLLPSLVARSWLYTGTETPDAPAGIAAVFTFGSAGLLMEALAVLISRRNAILAGIVLLGTTSFIRLGAAQYADVPVAFFFLAAIALTGLRDRLPGSGTPLLAGALAGLAAWTKNEGVLFFVLLAIAMKSRKQPIDRMLSGAVGVLVLLAVFKLGIAPSGYLTLGDLPVMFRDVTDPSRYGLIAAGFIHAAATFGGQYLNPLVPLGAALLLFRHKVKPGSRTATYVLSAMCVGFAFAYLITPLDLAWHMRFSLDRLLLQLWPAGLFTYFSQLWTPATHSTQTEL